MGSYLIISDNSNLRSVYNDLSQIQNSIIDLYWSVYSVNSGYNDIFTDRFSSQTGIDQGLSNYVFDSVNQCLLKPAFTNLVLVTTTWSSSQVNPSRCFIVIEVETSESLQLGVDLVTQISTNGGTSYTTVDLVEYQVVSITDYNKKYYYRGENSELPIFNSNQIKSKVVSTKSIKLHGIATGVNY